MSVVLALDCAVSGLGVALARHDACLACLREEGRDQAARLLPAIADALRQAGVDRRELSLIAVTVGPGSFTGVRVGLAAARGLAVALGVPLAGVTTTDVLLAQGLHEQPPGERLVVAAIDSRLGDWFCAVAEGAPTKDNRRPFLASAPALADRLEGRSCVVVGPEASALAALLPDAIAKQAPIDPRVLARLALAVGTEAWRLRNQGEGLPRPLYLRGVNVTLPNGARRTVE
jgi:tRNA threonylcarbamoyladenosine biosynthesis protein TsaB